MVLIWRCNRDYYMGGDSKGSTTTSTTAPPAYLNNAFQSLVGQAQQVASQPYQQYQGNLLAGLTQNQNTGINSIANTQGMTQPYTQQATNDVNAGSQAIYPQIQQFNGQNIANYENPYSQQVINSTMALANQQDQQQQSQLVGQAIQSGASPFGGDRAGVAAAALAGQQDLANNQTIAGLNNQNYNQATAEFNNQQQMQANTMSSDAWRNLSAGQELSGLGTQAQNNTLQQAQAQIGAGGLQQNQNQQALNIPYEQYVAQQAYPYQNLSWLSGIETGIGGVAGGTGSTTTPEANPWSQLLGSALGVSGIAKNLGYSPFGSSGSSGGSKSGGRINLASGGIAPYQPMSFQTGVPDADQSFIPAPQTGQAHANTPHAPQPQQQSGGGGGGGIGQMMGMLGMFGLKKGGIAHFDDGGNTDFNPAQNVANDVAAADTVSPAQQVANDVASELPPDAQGIAPPADLTDAGIAATSPKPAAENDLDNKPTVDHSGDTVALHSEGKKIDTGLPSYKETTPFRDPMGNLLISAGAAMMAGKSPNFLANVGAGLQAGLKTSEQQSQDEFERQQAQAKADQGADPNAPLGETAQLINMIKKENPNISIQDALKIARERNTQSAAMQVVKSIQANNPNLTFEQAYAIYKQKGAPYGSIDMGNSYGLEGNPLPPVNATPSAPAGATNNNLPGKLPLPPTPNQLPVSASENAASANLLPVSALGNAASANLPPLSANNLFPNSTQAPPANASATQAGAADDQNKEFDYNSYDQKIRQQLASKPTWLANTAYSVVRGDMPLSDVPKDQRMMVSSLVKQLDPDWTTNRSNIVKDYQINGDEGQTISSISVGMTHANELRDAIAALHNGNYTLLNSITQYLAEATGSPAPTNFKAVMQLYAPEIAKSAVGAGVASTGSEREESRKIISEASSPEQADGVADKYANLLAGKLMVKKNIYEQQTKRNDFNSFLTPETAAELNRLMVEQKQKATTRNALPAVAPKSQGAGITPMITTPKVNGDAASSFVPPKNNGAQQSPIDKARAAIAAGAPRDAVIQRLQQAGINTAGL